MLKEYDDTKEETKNSNNVKKIFTELNVLMFTKNKNIEIKCKIVGKINLYSCFIDRSFKKFATIDEEELTVFRQGKNNNILSCVYQPK